MNVIGEHRGCAGRHLVLKRGNSPQTGPLALASALGELEADGGPVPVVTLALRELGDQAWAEEVVPWLGLHGRRVIVRTRFTLARSLVEVFAEVGASVELEVGHHRRPIQQALLGPNAESLSALLLQAQHLGALGISTSVRLAPLFPGIHDEGEDFVLLLRQLAVAGLCDLHLESSVLHAVQVSSLALLPTRVLAPGCFMRMGRAFGLDPFELLGTSLGEGKRWQLDPYTKRALVHGLKREAEGMGFRVDACGCSAHCHVSRETTSTRPYLSVEGPELFAARSA